MAVWIEVILPSGRRVQMQDFHILPTAIDFSNPSKPKTMQERLPELIARLFSTEEIPFIIRDVRSGFTPPVTCLGLFKSEPMEPHEVGVDHSLLIVCWFTQRIDTSMRQLVCEGLSEVEWEKNARDFYSDW